MMLGLWTGQILTIFEINKNFQVHIRSQLPIKQAPTKGITNHVCLNEMSTLQRQILSKFVCQDKVSVCLIVMN